MISLLAALAIATVPEASDNSRTAVFDTKTIKAWCAEAKSNNAHRAACYYYVQGIEDGMLFSRMARRTGLSFCPPPGLTIEGSVNAIEAQLSDPRVHLEGPASTSVITALANSFPCESASQTPKPEGR